MNRALRTSQFLAFVGLGITMSLLGPLLPAIRAQIPMSYLETGLVSFLRHLEGLLRRESNDAGADPKADARRHGTSRSPTTC